MLPAVGTAHIQHARAAGIRKMGLDRITVLSGRRVELHEHQEDQCRQMHHQRG